MLATLKQLCPILLIACGSAGPVPAQALRTAPTRIILFIGDGVGTAYWTAALFAADKLAVQEFPVVGLVDTRSSDNDVTDSAAGATAFATGVRTYNYAIGVGPDSQPRPTLLELAQRRGLATGLVATSSITHATPASFAAHVPDRRLEPMIAAQLARANIDVLLGGGRGFFDGSLRPDSFDLLAGLRNRYAVIGTHAELAALKPDTIRALLGLFAPNQMPTAGQRTPTLRDMTTVALGVLDRNRQGFVLMVEGSQPDWLGHGNAPLEPLTREVLDFDAAIAVGLEYQRRRPETLIVVVADHETGGLALQPDSNGALVAAYTTIGHTATLVPLFARGPGAEAFAGIQPNDRIGRLLIERVRRATSSDEP